MRLKDCLLKIGIGLLFLAAGWGCGNEREESRPVNVLLISIDSLRADHVGCYGYGRETTPEIDQLASEGTVFANHVSTTSWTLPAHISLFTGQEISVHGVATDGFSLHPAVPTLAESLRAAGYRTAAFCSSPYMNPAFGFDRGFDLYHNIDTEKEDFVDTVLPSETERDRVHRETTSPRITELAENWLEENASEPFFLFLHFWDPHYDYDPPPPYDRIFNPGYTGDIDGRNYIHNDRVHPGMDPEDLEQIIALYDGEIAFTDRHLGMVLDKLKELDLYDRTLIIVTGDHGDEFFEHGNKGHRLTLYEEVIRVPLVISLPGKENQAGRVETTAGIIDIAPTILDRLGVFPPPTFQGESLLPPIKGTEPRANRFYLAELSPALYALRGDGLKLLHNALEDQTVVLDLNDDPGETHRDEITSGPLFEHLQREFETRRRQNQKLAEEIRGGSAGEEIRLQKRELERLRTLGYL
jgi:arylsulfatase A-like enzyme